MSTIRIKYSFLIWMLEWYSTFILKQLFNDLVPSQASFATFDNILNAWKLPEDKFQKFCWLFIHNFFHVVLFSTKQNKKWCYFYLSYIIQLTMLGLHCKVIWFHSGEFQAYTFFISENIQYKKDYYHYGVVMTFLVSGSHWPSTWRFSLHWANPNIYAPSLCC